MKKTDAFVSFVLTMLVLLFTQTATPAVPVVDAVRSLPTYYEDRDAGELKAVQLQDMADAIEAATDLHKPPGVKRKDWVALLIMVAWHESTLSLRIHRGDCKPYECDGGRARGPWQQHRNGRSQADWDALHGLEHVGHQAETASIQLRRGFLLCAKKGASDLPWLEATLNNYAGRSCSVPNWEGRDERVATWIKVRGKL